MTAYETAENELRDFALKQGLVLAQVSPRRYIVCRLDGRLTTSPRHIDVVVMRSEKVFGPADYHACWEYISDNVEKLW